MASGTAAQVAHCTKASGRVDEQTLHAGLSLRLPSLASQLGGPHRLRRRRPLGLSPPALRDLLKICTRALRRLAGGPGHISTCNE